MKNECLDFKAGCNVRSAGVCVLTARGMAAIGSVALYGAKAQEILGRIFTGAVPGSGRSVYGTIKDGEQVIDGVVAACEMPDYFVIHCHGNPLLVEQIVQLCQRYGAVAQWPEDYLFAFYRAESKTLVEAEARLAMTQAATLAGVELIGRQISAGLSEWVRYRLSARAIDLDVLREDCRQLLERSAIAKRVIEGVRIGLIGAPNSGKSTLLNWLAGTQEALVSQTAGTTRDWVSTVCRIGPLRVELVDTAGLDATMAAKNPIDRAAQEASAEVMRRCDLIMLVRDSTLRQDGEVTICDEKPVLTVFTKSDLLADRGAFRADVSGPWVLVSAVAGCGIEDLSGGILSALEVEGVSSEQAVCFTQRQVEGVRKIAEAGSEQIAVNGLMEILGELPIR